MPKSTTILVVDDDEKFLTFLSRTLKRAGYGVLTSSDGAEVGDLLLRQVIDLLVLDLQMPGMNGWEVIRSLRAQPPAAPARKGTRRRPKVVVVSGRDEPETAAFVQRLGADAYLTKPLWGRQLLDAVRQALGR